MYTHTCVCTHMHTCVYTAVVHSTPLLYLLPNVPRVSRCFTSTRVVLSALFPSPPTMPRMLTLTETRPLSMCMLWCRQRRGRGRRRGRRRSQAQTATGRLSGQPARWDTPNVYTHHCTHARVHTHSYIQTHTHTHTHTDTHTQTYTHTDTQRPLTHRYTCTQTQTHILGPAVYS